MIMTENEAIKAINDKYETLFALSTTNEFDMAMATAIKALDKQIPIKPAYQGEHEKCPTCGSFCIDVYCAKCGQKIDYKE